MGVTDFPFDFGFGNKGRHGVDYDHIHGIGFDKHFRNFKGFLGVGWLADQKRFEVNADPSSPSRIQGMLGVDEGGHASTLLGFRNSVKGHGCFARGLWPKDFDNPASGKPFASQGNIKR